MLFSWPVIQLILNILNILFGNGIKVCLLWDVLSNQPVCIFVCPTFPAVVRRCEREIDVGLPVIDRYQGPFVVLAYYRVDFQVTDPGFFFYDGRPV